MKPALDWEPTDYDEDPMVNAMMNIAEALHRQADATNALLYGLKYGKAEGMSIAEAIEVAGRKIAEAFPSAPDVADIASAIEGAGKRIAAAMPASNDE